MATAYGDCDAEAVASTGLTAVVPDSGVGWLVPWMLWIDAVDGKASM